MASRNNLSLLEHQLLGNYLEIFRRSIEEEIRKHHLKNKKINIELHANFLASLKAIREKVARSGSYDFKETQQDLERVSGQYLRALQEFSKNKELNEKELEAIQVSVGRALSRIEKVNEKAPRFQSTNLFIRFCKNFKQSILGLIHRKENMLLRNAVHSAKHSAFKKDMEDNILYLENANEALRREELLKEGENLYVKIFNHSPQKAIKLLPHRKNKPEKIAKFLAHSPLLKEEQLADYLGSQENEKILKEYIKRKYHFEEQTFTQAIRGFLGTFKLPVEGQKITRIMEAFSERYYEQNKGVFADKDAAYVLAVAVVMLNTDAYNPQLPAKKKMTEAQFINNLKGANGGKDFPSSLLSEIYRDIKMHEIKRLEEPSRLKAKPGRL